MMARIALTAAIVLAAATGCGSGAVRVDDAAAGKRYASDIPMLRGESFQLQCPALAKKIAEKVREAAAGAQ